MFRLLKKRSMKKAVTWWREELRFAFFFSQGFAVGVEDVNVVSAATEAREQSIGFI